jgi:integrase
MAKKKEYTLNAVNNRLTQEKAKCKIVQRGDALWAQATFPPKPGSDRTIPYQQKISMGVPASEDGFERAEREAKLISAELVAGKFDWSKYLKPELLPDGKPVSKLVKQFKAKYLETNDLTDRTWLNDWGRIYGKLPQNEPLTELAMMAVVNSTERNTRSRMEACRKLQTLANFTKVDVDLLQYKGGYGPSKVADRNLPTDEVIAQAWGSIKNREWQWAFGIMAAFGLRDHELFFCEWTEEGLYVTKGKTGPRLIFQALYPEWVDAWDLKTIHRPKVRDVEKAYREQKLGEKVARQFKRYGIPFVPYDLRHCYAIRSSVTFGFDIPVSAQLMGHSPTMHLKRYQKHLQRKQAQDAAQRIMQRPDRPSPPVI